MPEYQFKINDQPVNLSQAKISLERLEVSWAHARELVFRQHKQHHLADYHQEDNVELLVDASTVFLGKIKARRLEGEVEEEFVQYRAMGLRELSQEVEIVDPVTGVPKVVFNAPFEDEENFHEDRAGKSVGEIVKWLFDSFHDQLVTAGVIDQEAPGYVESELQAMDMVPPMITFVEVTFDEALKALVQFAPDFAYLADPATRTYHFKRLSTLTEKTLTINLSGDALAANILKPSTRGRCTAYKITGVPSLNPTVAYLSNSELEKYWDEQLEGDWTLAKAFQPEKKDTGEPSGGSAQTLEDTSKSWTEDEWAGGTVYLFSQQGLVGISQARKVASNTSNTLVIEESFNPEPAPGMSYRVEKGVSPYRYVYSRFRIVDQNKRYIAREIPKGHFLDSMGFWRRVPAFQRKVVIGSGAGQEYFWITVSVRFFYNSGVILTRTPLYGGDAFTPGDADGADDVRLYYAYKGPGLAARYPASGFTGTAYTEAGIQREKTSHDPQFKLAAQQNDYQKLAQEMLAPLKDIIYAGSIPLRKLDWSLVNLGYLVNVAAKDDDGNPITTGFESIKAQLASCVYEFRKCLTRLELTTQLPPWEAKEELEIVKWLTFMQKRLQALELDRPLILTMSGELFHDDTTMEDGSEVADDGEVIQLTADSHIDIDPSDGKGIVAVACTLDDGENSIILIGEPDPQTGKEPITHVLYDSQLHGNTSPCNYAPRWQ